MLISGIVIGLFVGILLCSIYYRNENLRNYIEQKIIRTYLKFKLKNVLNNLPYHTIFTFNITEINTQETLYCIYKESFEGTEKICVEKQTILTKKDFIKSLTDKEIAKFLTYTNNRNLIGFGFMTNNLHNSKSIINPEKFEQDFPEWYREKKILYIPIIAILKKYRKTRAFFSLIQKMVIYNDSKDCVSAYDYSVSMNKYLPFAITHVTNCMNRKKITRRIKVGQQNYEIIY